MRIRKNTYDINGIVGNVVAYWIVITFVATIALAMTAGYSQNAKTSCQTYNSFAEMANGDAFNNEARGALAEWEHYEDDLSEDGTFAMREEPVTFFDIAIVQHGGLTIAIVAGIMSAGAFVIYLCMKSGRYYLADLPFRKFMGWFVLISCFLAWPLFAISRAQFCMFRKKERQYEGEEEHKEEAEPAESPGIELPEIDPVFEEDEFVEFCREMLPSKKKVQRAQAELEQLEDIAKGCAKIITRQSELLKQTQADIGLKKASLNSLMSKAEADADNPCHEEQFRHDFAEIKSMRGVRQIYLDDDGDLNVTVRAAYEYEGDVYDIGDCSIVVTDNSLHAEIYRGNGRGHYNNAGEFCFGDRESEIDEYVEHGRIVEALEIAIECIHHINDGDLQSIPTNYKIIKC